MPYLRDTFWAAIYVSPKIEVYATFDAKAELGSEMIPALKSSLCKVKKV